MKYPEPLSSGILLKRYKRFLADVKLPDGREITLHCPNTGSMQGCAVEGRPVWFSQSNNAERKYPCTWELVEPVDGAMVGINTHRSNALVKEALVHKRIVELAHYDEIKAEVRFGTQNSRIDFLLSQDNQQCYVEVKTVTLGLESGQGLFPDAVTTRGSKHLQELMHMKSLGHRAVLLFCVQHTKVTHVSPADHIDAVYGKLLREAIQQGVEVFAYGAEIIPPYSIELVRPLEVVV